MSSDAPSKTSLVRSLVGDTHGYDPDHPEHLGWDLRLTADNIDRRANYLTATAQTLRIAAHQFDGLPNDTSHNDALAIARSQAGATDR